MDRRGQHRTPSPGHQLQHGYQLDDNPYGQQPQHMDDPFANHNHPQQNLDIPMGPGSAGPQRFGTPSDHLHINAAVCSPSRCHTFCAD